MLLTPIEITIDEKILEQDLLQLQTDVDGLEDVTKIIPLEVWSQLDELVTGFFAERFDEIKSMELSQRTIEIKNEAKKTQTPIPVWAGGGTVVSPTGIPSEWAGRFTNTLYEAVVNSGSFGESGKGMAKILQDEPGLTNAIAEWAIEPEIFYMAYPKIFNEWLVLGEQSGGRGLLYLSNDQLKELSNRLVSSIAERISVVLNKKGA